MLIYKVLRHHEFLNLEKERKSFGSTKDISDGFIHFSTKEQICETLTNHYEGETTLVLMAVKVDSISKNLKWEKSRAGQAFPHLYSELNIDNAVWFAPIELDEGEHIMPPDF